MVYHACFYKVCQTPSRSSCHQQPVSAGASVIMNRGFDTQANRFQDLNHCENVSKLGGMFKEHTRARRTNSSASMWREALACGTSLKNDPKNSMKRTELSKTEHLSVPQKFEHLDDCFKVAKDNTRIRKNHHLSLDKRRWGWIGDENNFDEQINSALRFQKKFPEMFPIHKDYENLYTPNKRAVSRSRSINKVSVQKSKVLRSSSTHSAKSFSSIYGGTSLNLRPVPNNREDNYVELGGKSSSLPALHYDWINREYDVPEVEIYESEIDEVGS